MNPSRKDVVMLVPHDPVLDPRIDWEATYAAKNFNVTVVGINSPGLNNEVKTGNDYRIKLLARINQKNNVLFFFYSIFSLIPGPLRYLIVFVALLLTPLLIALEVFFNIAAKIYRFIVSILKHLIRKIALFWNELCTVSLILKAMTMLLSKLKRDRYAATEKVTDSEFNTCHWYLMHIAMVTMTFWHEMLTGLDTKPDVIHCNDIYSLLVGLIAKKRFGSTVIYDMHEYAPYVDPHASWFRVWIWKQYERFLIKKADHVVTVNPMLANLVEKNYKLKKVFSVPNAAPWKENSSSVVFNEMTILAQGRVKFLFQGCFSPARGIDELINTWRNVDKTKAALFLRGPDNELRDQYIDLAKDLGLLDTAIYFLDPVKEDQLIDAAREADIGLIPYQPIIINHRYACPNKLSQYMQAGLMVISNNLCYVKQIVEESQSGLVYDSTISFIDALRLASDDAKFRHACKKNALVYAKNTFNWQEAYRKLEDLYMGCG